MLQISDVNGSDLNGSSAFSIHLDPLKIHLDPPNFVLDIHLDPLKNPFRST